MNRRKFLSATATLGALSLPVLARGANPASPAAAPKAKGASSVKSATAAASEKDAARAAATSPGAEDATALFFGTPVAGAPEADAFTVVTALNAAALVRVEYGEVPPAGDPPPDEAQLREILRHAAEGDGWGFVAHDDKVVQIRIGGLRPGTRYFWRLAARPLSPPRGGAKTSFSKTYITRTLGPAAAESRFTVWNDTHDNAKTIRALHALTLRPNEAAPAAATVARDDFLFWNGDLCNNIERRAQLPGTFVSPEGADLAALPPVLISRGNHDVRGHWANKVPDYVAFPGRRPYCAFRSGPVAAVMLDTGEDKPDAHPTFRGVAAFAPLIAEQAAWLAEVIQRPGFRDAPYRVVFCHIPLRWRRETTPNYDKGGYDDFSRRGRDAWAASLIGWGAQVIVSGHMHEAAHIPANAEWPFAQLVGGGPSLNTGRSGATILRAHADAKRLRFEMRHASAPAKAPLFQMEFSPLA